MLISKTPLRISLGGGGTDLPSYYEKNEGGFLIAAAIDKYIYISVHDNFSENLLLKYSKIEDVKSIEEIEHPIIRESLRLTGITKSVEISSMADIPAGTGLGSSGSFTVGLLKGLTTYANQIHTNFEIASRACTIEINTLKEPVGKQDQYIAAIGGLTAFEFRTDGTVFANSVRMDKISLKHLEENLLLFYTGIMRSASDELHALEKNVTTNNSVIRENLNEIKKNGFESLRLLELNKLDHFGKQLTKQWRLKLERSPSMLHKDLNEKIQFGIDAGALGGKLIGAGGGGFLMFYAEDKNRLRVAMNRIGLKEITFNFDYLGSRIIQ